MFQLKKSKMMFLLPKHEIIMKMEPLQRIKLLKEIESESEVVLETKLSNFAKKYYEMARAVSSEIHYHKMFIRLNFETKMILTTTIEPRHDIEDLILDFFFNRFPGFNIILHSVRKKLCYFIIPNKLLYPILNKHPSLNLTMKTSYIIGNTRLSLKHALQILSNNVDENPHYYEVFDSNSKTKELFRAFYHSQFIASRKNHKLFYKNFPKKFLGLKHNQIEQSFHTKTLDTFIKKK
jgi:hypothetical protein